jgi:LysM repeat protein
MNTPGINPAANYTIQPGDTLTKIAARTGTTVDALAQANNIANPNMIFAGQNLTIPTNTMASGIGNFLGGIFGGGQNQGGLFGGGQNQGGLFGGGLGGGLGTLANLAVARNILRQSPDTSAASMVPTGISAFGYTPEMIAALSNKDYGIGNLQPALIQGQQYANINPENMPKSTPITMAEKGGEINPDRMDDDGPGDITPAFLEPGEFVMTRPATRVLGARNLYKLMKEAEQMA